MVEWDIQLKDNERFYNYIPDVLNYNKQIHAYSCGFDVLPKMCPFAEDNEDIHSLR